MKYTVHGVAESDTMELQRVRHDSVTFTFTFSAAPYNMSVSWSCFTCNLLLWYRLLIWDLSSFLMYLQLWISLWALLLLYLKSLKLSFHFCSSNTNFSLFCFEQTSLCSSTSLVVSIYLFFLKVILPGIMTKLLLNFLFDSK